MKLREVSDIQAFLDAVDQCTGSVILMSENGDQFNLKSVFCNLLVLQEIKKMKDLDLEVYARKREDQAILLKFFEDHKEVLK